jgi:hypothetical protein
MTTRDKIKTVAATLTETTEGNPRLVLDIRFYEDGHTSFTAQDEHGHGSIPVPCPDDATLIACVAMALADASRKARRTLAQS